MLHLWQNLVKAVERCVAAHRAFLREPDPESVTEPAPGPPAEPVRDRLPESAGKLPQRPYGGGPGQICVTTATGQSCDMEGSPWPWLAAGTLLAVAGIAAFAALRSRLSQ